MSRVATMRGMTAAVLLYAAGWGGSDLDAASIAPTDEATTTCSTSPCFGSNCAMAIDPTGDATLSSNVTAAPYQDIVEAQVSKTGEVFSFVMNLAAGIPPQPVMPPQMKLLEWSFRLDTDPLISPAGFPNDQGGPAPADFYVFVTWDGASFAGYVIDRQSEVTGGDPIITNVPFCFSGSGIGVSVKAAILGNPSNFGWRVFTQDWNSPFGNNASHVLDLLPEGYHAFLPWPDDATTAAALLDAHTQATTVKLCCRTRTATATIIAT